MTAIDYVALVLPIQTFLFILRHNPRFFEVAGNTDPTNPDISYCIPREATDSGDYIIIPGAPQADGRQDYCGFDLTVGATTAVCKYSFCLRNKKETII